MRRPSPIFRITTLILAFSLTAEPSLALGISPSPSARPAHPRFERAALVPALAFGMAPTKFVKGHFIFPVLLIVTMAAKTTIYSGLSLNDQFRFLLLTGVSGFIGILAAWIGFMRWKNTKSVLFKTWPTPTLSHFSLAAQWIIPLIAVLAYVVSYLHLERSLGMGQIPPRLMGWLPHALFAAWFAPTISSIIHLINFELPPKHPTIPWIASLQLGHLFTGVMLVVAEWLGPIGIRPGLRGATFDSNDQWANMLTLIGSLAIYTSLLWPRQNRRHALMHIAS